MGGQGVPGRELLLLKVLHCTSTPNLALQRPVPPKSLP